MTALSTDSPPFRFYGAECSYFTGKARPALRAKRLYFEEILPTPEAYREIHPANGHDVHPGGRHAGGRDVAGHQRHHRCPRSALSRAGPDSRDAAAAHRLLPLRGLRGRVHAPAGDALPLERTRVGEGQRAVPSRRSPEIARQPAASPIRWRGRSPCSA